MRVPSKEAFRFRFYLLFIDDLNFLEIAIGLEDSLDKLDVSLVFFHSVLKEDDNCVEYEDREIKSVHGVKNMQRAEDNAEVRYFEIDE